MKGLEQRRTLWLGGALLIALLAAQWVNGQDGSGDQVSTVPEQKVPQREKREMRASEDDSAQLELDRLERRKFSAQAGDLFSPKSWIPPPPPTKAQPPSPPPGSLQGA